ncbi:MAG: hypothetical protein CSA22_02325 [Deltaproteobacteria bacterium]|nr:MAG: hypothetical protein CSA22_02325 [Deltaproteobacteria bacterium]
MIIGIGLYNQKRLAAAAKSRSKSKISFFLENHILTQKELDKAISIARERKKPIEKNVLFQDLKIPRENVGQSLGRYYGVPYIPFHKHTTIPGE